MGTCSQDGQVPPRLDYQAFHPRPNVSLCIHLRKITRSIVGYTTSSIDSVMTKPPITVMASVGLHLPIFPAPPLRTMERPEPLLAPQDVLRSLREDMGLTRVRLALIIAVFWSAVAALIFLQSTILHRLMGMEELSLVDRIQYVIRWTLWALLTPGILWLAVRFPFRRDRWPVWLCAHLFFSVMVIALEFLIEMPIIRPIAAQGFGIHDPLLAYIQPFIAKFHIYLLLYFLVNGFMNVLLYFARYRAAELRTLHLKADLTHAQLQTLRGQLQPHFLFNAHHAIGALIAKGEQEKAITMLTQLSDLLRFTIDHPEGRSIPLRDELDLLDRYLAIQRTRFADRLAIERSIPTECLDARIPGLLLQPIVENGIQHGIGPKPEGGTIGLRIARMNDRLRIEVSDDGVGSPDRLREGVGLRNTRERLAHLYDGASSFTIGRNPDGPGTLVRIELPFTTTE